MDSTIFCCVLFLSCRTLESMMVAIIQTHWQRRLRWWWQDLLTIIWSVLIITERLNNISSSKKTILCLIHFFILCPLNHNYHTLEHSMQRFRNVITSSRKFTSFFYSLFSIKLFQSHVSNQNFIRRRALPYTRALLLDFSHFAIWMAVVLLLSSSSHYLFYIFFNLMSEPENAFSVSWDEIWYGHKHTRMHMHTHTTA